MKKAIEKLQKYINKYLEVIYIMGKLRQKSGNREWVNV